MILKIQKLLLKLAIITNVNQFTEPQYHLNWSQAKILKISNSRFSSLCSQKKHVHMILVWSKLLLNNITAQ